MIKSGHYVRIIDPAAALFNTLRSVKSEECSHEISDSQMSLPINSIHEIWAFDKLLRGWCPSNPGFGDQ